ncbi:CMA1 Chymase, partial [Polypterus senegalus]
MKTMLGVYWSTTLAICVTLAGVSGDKIIDGEEAKPHSRPYMAFLMIKRDKKIYQCGGFLILPNFILTAAHCKGQTITALLGAHNHSKKEKSWQEIPVKEIIPHECFNNITKVNDIMLLKLKHSAKIKQNVGTISIPKRGDGFSPNNCYVAGWGRTETNGKGSSVLREVKVNVNVHVLSISQIFARGTGIKGVSGDKIIDGTEAKAHSRPYMAFLEIRKGKNISSCGGFLILPNFILTAAHCQGKSITVLLGAHDLSKKESSQQVIPVEKIIPHESYNDITLENDIMLLKLQHKANLTNEVKTISIPKRNEAFNHKKCSVAGWGRTKTNGTGSHVLREVEVNVNFISRSRIFARGNGIKGACNGDSGGPLVCPGFINKPTAVGIVSYGPKTCEDQGSNAYTKVSAYRDWIEKKINASSSA